MISCRSSSSHNWLVDRVKQDDPLKNANGGLCDGPTLGMSGEYDATVVATILDDRRVQF
jgi:hypothetical protein